MKSSLGHYRVVEKLGAGGMGEVYLAEDSKLGRKVALKILPPELDESPERLQRFESEARAIAALNHPNIVTVYSVEEAEGIRFLSMELVRGKTLAVVDRLTLKEFFEVAIPLVDGVAAAHQEGIVHRDLKPDNVMLTDEGVVKILDFGLAKMRPRVGGDGGGASDVPTRPMTSPGIIIGTVAYMSPEQAEAKTVDARSDIFSLGIIFYRLLAGRHPFSGDSAASVLSGILKDTPSFADELDSRVPYELSRIIRRCLEKSLTKRYQSALDLRNDLQELADDLESGQLQKRSTLPSSSRRRFPRWLPWALAASLGVVAAETLLRTENAPPVQERRFVLKPLDGQLRGMVLSRDGSMLAAPAYHGDGRSVYLHSPADFELRRLDGTLGAAWPFFSPDGEWIGFTVNDKTLKKIPVGGGDAVILCDAGDVLGASWGDDGNIVYGGVNQGLRRVAAEGGAIERLLEPDPERGDLDFHFPQVLPGSKGILFTRHDKRGTFAVEVFDVDKRARKLLLRDAFFGHYVSTGHLLFARGHTLFAAPFDLRRMEISGPGVAVVDNVRTQLNDGYADFSIGENGTLVYRPEPSRSGRFLVWVDRKGREERLPLGPRAYSNPRLSPNGKELAYGVLEGDRQDLWVYDLESQSERRVTFEGFNESPVFTPDGRKLTFTSDADGIRNLYWKPSDGTGVAERLTRSDLRQWPFEWSRDGGALLLQEADPTDLSSIRLLRLEGEGEPRVEPFVSRWKYQGSPRISPDGHWIVYSAEDEIYVQPFPGPGGPRQISTTTGFSPVWSRDGREIYYRSRGTMVAVSIETSPSVRTGKPRALFELHYIGALFGSSYDVAPDGRFLMIVPSEDENTPPPIYVIQGWFQELSRRVPTTGH